jgi:peptide chain release factor 2
VVNGIRINSDGLKDARELLELAEMDDDQDTADSVVDDVEKIAARVEKLEFQRMFSGDHDASNAFVDIQAGAGGTEAQDWAEMMLRMYLRWCENRGWKTELMEVSAGEVAGIDQAIGIAADFADDLVQRRAFLAQRLGAFGLVPDRRVFQFATDFLETLYFRIEVKDTP